MPYTTESSYTGDGSTTDFQITFPFLETRDVKVRVDNVTQSTSDYSVSGTVLTFTTAPANTKAVLIFRDTYIEKTNAVFQAGASIRASDLNTLAKQFLYAAQEFEQASTTPSGTGLALTASQKNDIEVHSANDWTIVNDAVTGSKIADDAINSEHYTDLSIDTQHIANDQVTYAKIQDIVTANRVLGRASAGEVQEVQVATDMIANDAVTYAKIQDIGTANRVLGRASTGEVQEVQVAEDMVASDAISEAKLKISNAGSNGQFLQKQSGNTGGLTWASESEAGPLRGFKTVKYTGTQQAIGGTMIDVTDLSITYTPTLSSSIIVLEAHLCLNARAQDQTSSLEWSSFEQQFTVTPSGGSASVVAEAQVFSTGASHQWGGNSSYGAYLKTKWNFYEEYTNSNTTEKTFKVQLREINGTLQVNTTGGYSYFTLKEYTP